MQYRMFQIPVSGVSELVNGFVGSHWVLRVERQLVVAATGAYWAFCSLADFPKASGWTIMGWRPGVAAVGGWLMGPGMTARARAFWSRWRGTVSGTGEVGVGKGKAGKGMNG